MTHPFQLFSICTSVFLLKILYLYHSVTNSPFPALLSHKKILENQAAYILGTVEPLMLQSGSTKLRSTEKEDTHSLALLHTGLAYTVNKNQGVPTAMGV